MPTLVLGIVAVVLLAAATDSSSDGVRAAGGVGILLYIIATLAAAVFEFWNLGWRQGETGQSIGKSRVGIAVIRKDGSGYLGGGMGIVRTLLHGILGACFLNFLWPLWDDQNQTWTDMVLDTVVVKT